jgi:hypothetical protein
MNAIGWGWVVVWWLACLAGSVLGTALMVLVLR